MNLGIRRITCEMNRTRLAATVCLVIAAVTASAAAETAAEKSGLASLDANNDHAISRQEAANAQVEAFRAMDRNGDDRLSRDELAASQPQPDKDAEPTRSVKRARARALDQRFANLDADHGGDISLAEYQAAMTPYFDRLDANGDGVIGGGELRRAYGTDEKAASKPGK